MNKIAFGLIIVAQVFLMGACKKGATHFHEKETMTPKPEETHQSALRCDAKAVRAADTPLAVAWLYCAVGDAYRSQDDDLDAGEAYDKAFEFGRNDADLCRHVGDGRQAIEDTDEAEEAYERAKALSAMRAEDGPTEADEVRPVGADDYVALAEAYEELGCREAMLAAYQKAIAVAPDEDLSFDRLGQYYCTLGMLDEALDSFFRTPDADPDGLGAPELELWMLCLERGRHEDGVRVAEKVLSRRPSMPSLWQCFLGQSYEGLCRWQESLAAYEEGLRLAPDYPLASLGMARVFKETGREDEAKAAANQALAACDNRSKHKPSVVLDLFRADALCLLGRWEEAIAVYEEFIRQKDEPIAPEFIELGFAYSKVGRFEDAIATTERAIEISPRWATAHSSLGWYYTELGRYEDAIAACNKALDIDPDSYHGLTNLGWAYFKADRHHEAIAAYEEAIRLYPDNADSHSGLGKAYLGAGNKPAALEQYKILKGLDPKQAEELKTAIDAA